MTPAAPEDAPPQSRFTRYWFQWLIVLALFILLVLGLRRSQREPGQVQPPNAQDSVKVSWYFLVQLPHLTDDKDGDAYPGWIKDRLTALQQAGFHPMRFSDILAALRQGQGLPRGTVGLFYEQGYRTTIETIWPVFQEMKTPVSLLTPTEPLQKGDWGYISQYRAYSLRRSGQWDVGYYRGETPRRVTLWSSQEKPLRIGPENGPPFWFEDPAEHVINRGLTSQYRRLFFNPDWSTAELCARMQAEIPVERPSWLSVRSIQGRLWGVTLDKDGPEPPAFRVQPAASLRTASVAWRGTRGIPNFDLTVDAQKVFGEVWLLLRSDPATAQGIRVGFPPEKVVVDIPGTDQPVVLASAPRPRPAAGLHAAIELRGSDLKVRQGNQVLLQVTLPPAPPRPDGVVQLMVYDRLHGTALAENILLSMTPLP